MERGQEPVAELEIVGSVKCDSFNQLSEVLWIRTITPSRTQLRGLAHRVRKISDFLLSVSLWVSWVLLSLGKLVISSFWTKTVVALSQACFWWSVLWSLWGLQGGLAVNPLSVSVIGAGLRKKLACAYTGENLLENQRPLMCVFRHSEVDSVGPRSHGEGEAAQLAQAFQLPEAAQDGQEDGARRQEV